MLLQTWQQLAVLRMACVALPAAAARRKLLLANQALLGSRTWYGAR
jgi:hypothetical protein